MHPSPPPETSITFACGHCGTTLRVAVELAGETGPCPRCGLVITAPLVSSVAGPALRPRPAAELPPIPGPVYEPPLTVLEGGWERRSPVLRPAERPADSGNTTPAVPAPRAATGDAVPPDQGRPPGGLGGWNDAPEGGGRIGRREVEERRRGSGWVWLLVAGMLGTGAGFAAWRAGWWHPEEWMTALNRTGGGESPETAALTTAGSVEVPVPEPEPPKAPVPVSGAGIGVAPVPAPPAEALPEAKRTEARPPVADPSDFLGGAGEPPVEPMGPQIRRETVAGNTGGDEAGMERARAAVRKFLEASSWRERVDAVWTRGNAEEVLEAYYAQRPDLSVQHYRLDFFHRETLADGSESFVFFLTYGGESDGFPVLVRGRGEDCRLDWDLFVEFRERTFQKFVEERPEIPGRFRLVIQRVTYLEPDREEIPDSEAWHCFRLDPPYPGWTRHAFVAKDSPAGEALGREVPWEAEPMAVEVELGWETFPNGKRFLALRRLVAKGWAEPGS